MTYRIATIPTLNGTRFYIEANGKRRQGGFATQQKAIAKIDELKAYDEIKIQRDLPPASAARLLRRSPLRRRRDQKKGTWTLIRPGLWRAEDGREKCTPAELKYRKDKLLRDGTVCAACDGRSKIEAGSPNGCGRNCSLQS
jgi:hypothetical protein